MTAVDDERLATLGRSVGERSVACAESCTAGAVAEALAGIEGSGDWFLGGVVAYHRDVKHSVLGVTEGPVVNSRTAEEMAAGVARLLKADLAVSTTGACGPVGLDGAAPGTVVIGWFLDGVTGSETHVLPGEPHEVAREATRRALVTLDRVARGLM